MSPVLPDSWRLVRAKSVDAHQWRALAARDVASSAFHDPRFLELFARHRPGSEAVFLELRDDQGALMGGLPFLIQRRGPFQALTSGPAGSYGGPIALGSDCRQWLVDAYLSFGGARTLRREMLCRAELTPPPPQLLPATAGYLSLERGFEAFLRESFPRNRRNECNRSEKRGVVFGPVQGEAELSRFHAILGDFFVQWKTPPLALEFLRSLVEEMPAFRLFLVRHEGEVIGGHLCAEHGDEFFPWVGATERRDGIFPAPYLIREEARFAAARGLRVMNLGASKGLSGVADFKRLLGASERTQWHLFRESPALGLVRKRTKVSG